MFGSMGGGLDSEEVSIIANSDSTKTSIQVKWFITDCAISQLMNARDGIVVIHCITLHYMLRDNLRKKLE